MKTIFSKFIATINSIRVAHHKACVVAIVSRYPAYCERHGFAESRGKFSPGWLPLHIAMVKHLGKIVELDRDIPVPVLMAIRNEVRNTAAWLASQNEAAEAIQRAREEA